MKVQLIVEVEVNEDTHNELNGAQPTTAELVAHVAEVLASDERAEGLYSYSVTSPRVLEG